MSNQALKLGFRACLEISTIRLIRNLFILESLAL